MLNSNFNTIPSSEQKLSEKTKLTLKRPAGPVDHGPIKLIKLKSGSTNHEVEEDALEYALDGIGGQIEYDFKLVLETFINKLRNKDTFTYTSRWGHDPVTFYFPSYLDWGVIFNPLTFLYVFRTSFGIEFEKNRTYQTQFGGFTIYLNPEYLGNQEVTLTFDESHYFRSMFCLLMGTLLKIRLSCCSCYPKTFLEWSALHANIKMNCISQECSSWLQQHSETYDSIFVGDCSQAINQLALVNINATANQVATNIKLKISTKLGEINKLLAESRNPAPNV